MYFLKDIFLDVVVCFFAVLWAFCAFCAGSFVTRLAMGSDATEAGSFLFSQVASLAPHDVVRFVNETVRGLFLK